MSVQLGEQREREMRRALDRIENDLDDGRVRPRGSSSPDSLPVIIDRGPYRGYFYPKDQLYFNSIMLAADIEPIYASPPGGALRQETHRTPIRRPRGDSNDRSPSPRPVPSEWLTASQNAENLRRWEERNGIRPAPARAKAPSSMQPPPRPSLPPRGPITPGTREWDKFMDFPSDNTYHIHRHDIHGRFAETPVRRDSSASSQPAVVSEPETLLAYRDVHTLPEAQAGHLLPLTQTSGISPIEAEPTRAVTWASALDRILRNEVVDLTTRAMIRERSPRSFTTGRPEYEETPPVAPADVGYVPNFSYPITASAFYNRVGTAQAHSPRLPREEQRYEELLLNGIHSEHYSYANSNDSVYRNPTPPNWPLRGGQDGHRTPTTNGVPPGYYPQSSSDDSSDTSIDPHQRSPSPPNHTPEQVSALLRSLLTPSELAIHCQIVYETTPAGASSQAGSAPQHARLIRKLDTAVYGLQDRIAGLKDDLIPQLSTWLQQKGREIGEQDVEISRLRKEVTELKRAVDFSTRILNQCRNREWEVWRTLLGIQQKREERHSSLARILFKRRSSSVQDIEVATPNNRGTEASPPRGADKGLLKKKELDALLLMAKQNVDIIEEDMREMVETVQAYLERNKVVGEEDKRVEEPENDG
jgi:hypothetical protein